MDLEDFYARLPIPLQNLATSLEGWRIQRSRYGPGFQRYLPEYLERADWEPSRIRAFRDQRLARFIEHAVTSVPHYRDLFREFGARPADFRTLDDLSQLPILTKQEVQNHTGRFISNAVPSGETRMAHTSGTTGAGLRFPVSEEAQWEQWAVWWRFRLAHGLSFDTPCLYLGGRSVVPLDQRRPPFWRHNRPGKQIFFSGYHLSRETASAYLQEMRRTGWQWLHGYPSLVSLLASYALELDQRLALRWVSLGAENILPQQSAQIEAAFGVRPITHYGMAEGVANISLSPEGQFVVDEDYAAVEFVPREDGQYDIIGTNFTNRAFPLIRYQVGDLATLPVSPAGYAGPRIVAQLDGRKEDYVVTRAGALIGRLDHVFKDMVNVREAQIRQSRVGEMTLHIVRGARYTGDDEQKLLSATRKRVGDDVSFDIAYCDALPRTPGGKLRFVVSELGEGQLAGLQRRASR